MTNPQTDTLHKAARIGDVKMVEKILLNGASVCSYTAKDKTALHVACQYGHEKVLRLLIKHGCLGTENQNPASTDDSIIIALLKKGPMYTHCVNLLIEAGYPIHQEASQLYNELQNQHLTNGMSLQTMSCFIQELENPPPLKRACRTVIRKSLGDRKIIKKLDRLSVMHGGVLPESLVRYLKLEQPHKGIS